MDLKQIIRMHMRFPDFQHNLEYFKDKYPEICRQVEKELDENARTDSPVDFQSGNIHQRETFPAIPGNSIHRHPAAGGSRGPQTSGPLGTRAW